MMPIEGIMGVFKTWGMPVVGRSPTTIAGWNAMTNEIRNQDRKDQAIGRVIRLLPYLPIRELDALADRLSRDVEADASPVASQIDRDFPTRNHARNVASPQPQGQPIDMVGH